MSEFIIGKCKCGGSVLAEFGFSCSGKPKTKMRCDRCGKVSITIGNNNNLMKLWEGTDSTEYIDRRKLLKKVKDIELIIPLNRADYKTELIQAVKLYENAILKAILTEPSADVVEVRHGEWVPYEMQIENNTHFNGFLLCGTQRLEPINYRCSLCGRIERFQEPYCNYGAKMDGKGDLSE